MVKYGNKSDLATVEKLVAMTNSLNNDQFEKEITTVLNVNQYLTWLAGVVCTQNFDGFIHNYALYQNSENETLEISPWDYDGTWGRNIHGKRLRYNYIPITGYNTLTARLLHFPKFKEIYRDILASRLENDFTIETQEEIIENLFSQLKPYIHLDPFIKITGEDLDKEKEYILDFIQNRNAYLKQEMIKLQ